MRRCTISARKEVSKRPNRPVEIYMHTPEANDVFGLVAVSRGLLFRLLPSGPSHVEAEPPAPPTRRRGWLERLDLWLNRVRQRDIESYLAQSHDVFELERRIRELERANSSWLY